MNDRVRSIVAVAAAAAGAMGIRNVAAQEDADIVSAGNGGVATGSASGGSAAFGAVNSGGNAGNAVGVGDSWGGAVGVDGGSAVNTTSLGTSVNGGTAIADASGGDYNLAFVS